MKSLIIFIVAVVLVVGGWMIFKSASTTSESNESGISNSVGVDGDLPQTGEGSSNNTVTDNAIGEKPNTVSTLVVNHTNSGFVPKVITINKGDTVRFVEQSSNGAWVASNPHPTHTGYPEKSSTDCSGSSFDSCKELHLQESWKFTFNTRGSWNYHNHIQPSEGGTIIVK